MGASALFGFPTTYILANEIANSVGENDAEKNYLRSHLQPHMVIAGIVTVSISSVVFAGIVAIEREEWIMDIKQEALKIQKSSV